MRQFTDLHSPEIAGILNSGGIAVLRTDTIYGVVARADNEQAVQRVYELKGRDDNKSPIVLVSRIEQLFDAPDELLYATLNGLWPDKVSIILPSKNAPTWITRGNHSVAYRMPASNELRALIDSTGPLIAPSANPQGAVPAINTNEAFAYFGEKVDCYVEQGSVKDNTPSRLLRLLLDGTMERLR